jgi:dGTPase
MPGSIRELIEERERASLSPFAATAADSQGRRASEPDDPVRTAFQRDRDRILHSKAFRRLKRKTQVFIDPAGDHYRTRMTHSLEVSQVARTIGRALRLNEDLIEAIALGHDLGHPPFGHAGEHALDAAIRDIARCPPESEQPVPGGFRHDLQSLRVVEVLENLNLTQETLAGIGGHSKGRNDLSDHDGAPTSTLEAATVRLADRIAYLNHDVDDALRSGMIEAIPASMQILSQGPRGRIGQMVIDVIEHSLDQPRISMSTSLLAEMNAMKEWMFENVYLLYPKRYPDIPRAQNVVTELFHHYLVPGNLPAGYSGVQGAIDYVSGMTDRFAIDTYAELKLPRSWRST